MIGQTLGDYCIDEELGAGGLGVMCRTTDSKLRQQLAIKVLSEAFVRHPERLARFALPVSGFAPLRSPIVVSPVHLDQLCCRSVPLKR